MKIDKQTALKIAHEDASIQYRNLSIYDITIELVNGHWKVDYTLKDKNSQGGGPHYLIATDTGIIVSRRYEQ